MIYRLIAGASYRLVIDAKIGNCSFNKGDVVTYSSGGYSPYDDCYVFHFVDSAGVKLTCISQVDLTIGDTNSFENLSLT